MSDIYPLNTLDTVVYYIESGTELEMVAHIILKNPPVNALSAKLLEELHSVFSDINQNKNIKLAWIYSLGKHFSAGADLKEKSLMSDKETLEYIDNINRCFNLLENLEVPTICGIHGATLGGGAELALCCDIIIVKPEDNDKNHKIGFPEVNLGIIPGAGGTYRIYKKMNPGFAKYWVLSGKQFSLKEAYEYGFVDFIFDTNDDFSKFLKSFLNTSRTSLIAAKKSMNKCYLESDRKKQGLIELEGYKKTLESPEKKEALEKYKKK